MVVKKKNPLFVWGGIEKSVPRDHHLLSLGKPWHWASLGDPWDRFFYPTLTLMMDSYSPTIYILGDPCVLPMCDLF